MDFTQIRPIHPKGFVDGCCAEDLIAKNRHQLGKIAKNILKILQSE